MHPKTKIWYNSRQYRVLFNLLYGNHSSFERGPDGVITIRTGPFGKFLHFRADQLQGLIRKLAEAGYVQLLTVETGRATVKLRAPIGATFSEGEQGCGVITKECQRNDSQR